MLVAAGIILALYTIFLIVMAVAVIAWGISIICEKKRFCKYANGGVVFKKEGENDA